MKALDIMQTRSMLISVADAIIANKPYLTEVDSLIGDGDHGIGMAGGLEKAKAKLLEKEDFADINQLFKAVGNAMMMSMGGASGVIFGTMFSGGVKGLESKTELDGDTLTVMMRKAVDAVKDRGKAQVGDKTMVDAFEPAVVAMEQGDKSDLCLLLQLAATGAKEGMENTKNYIAKFGRAKSLMERSIGFQDAGATSVWIIFNAMKEFVEKL